MCPIGDLDLSPLLLPLPLCIHTHNPYLKWYQTRHSPAVVPGGVPSNTASLPMFWTAIPVFLSKAPHALPEMVCCSWMRKHPV